MLVVQILNDCFHYLGGIVEIVWKAFGNHLALEDEFVAVIRVDSRIIRGTYQASHINIINSLPDRSISHIEPTKTCLIIYLVSFVTYCLLLTGLLCSDSYRRMMIK